MNRGLAWCGKIIEINPIPGADLIEAATVVCGPGGRWQGVVKKGDFAENDFCEVYVQDALLPQIERFAFMEPRGWRIRMMRLKGVPSECLIMSWEQDFEPVIGDNITERVGVTKYEREVSLSLAGDQAGPFPGFIPKTDEPNFQGVTHLVNALYGREWYATLKYDGSSGTAYWKDGELHMCSRNHEMKDKPGTAVWELARKYNLAGVLEKWASLGINLAVQFEMVGPKIQKNPLGLKETEIRIFNLYTWGGPNAGYFGPDALTVFCDEHGLPMVDTVRQGEFFDLDSEALRKLAEQKYPNGRHAEGIVVRPRKEMRVLGERVSFKVINLLYRN
jgi:RNA ligase (TIGR02306 family)